MKYHTKESIAALLTSNNNAVYRALVVLSDDGRLNAEGDRLAQLVLLFNDTPQNERKWRFPMSLRDLQKARELVLPHAQHLAGIANRREQEAREMADEIAAEQAMERYYEDRYETAYRQDHPYDD